MNAKYFSFSPQYQFFPPKREHKIPISIYPHLRENSKINYYNKHMVTLGMKSLKILSFGQKKKNGRDENRISQTFTIKQSSRSMLQKQIHEIDNVLAANICIDNVYTVRCHLLHEHLHILMGPELAIIYFTCRSMSEICNGSNMWACNRHSIIM